MTACTAAPLLTPAAQLAALARAMGQCRRCAALARGRTQVVAGAGDLPARVAFVGIAPGRLGGDRTGVPFLGDRSGDLLREMIEQAGLSEVFITNLVRCSPRDRKGRNRDPRPREIAQCRRFLHAELVLASPPIIACLGRLAWYHVAGARVPFDPACPAPHAHQGWRCYPMYHPGYVIRGAYSRARYREDFLRLRRVLEQL
ncbi:MAG TPA: uracil-DNA glycosylase [Candidatus Binataceae bacterium]|nr:uracil-DNA glycosylase [Candidatus Binataceae bacterium]